MKKLINALLVLLQFSLLWQKFWAYDSLHWGAVFIPCYIFALIGLIAIIVMEMQDNEHPNDFNP
jgi:ABC-type multidrug transport system permease subunit